jgi:hypothetical protein
MKPVAVESSLSDKLSGEKQSPVQAPANYTQYQPVTEEYTWTETVQRPETRTKTEMRSRKQPESNLAYAREMTLPMHLALASWRVGRKVEWNPEKEKIVGDKEANKLLARKYRKAWDLV